MAFTITGKTAELIEWEARIRGYDSPEALVVEAVQLLLQQKLNEGIKRGMKDIEEDNLHPLNKQTLPTLIDLIHSDKTL